MLGLGVAIMTVTMHFAAPIPAEGPTRLIEVPTFQQHAQAAPDSPLLAGRSCQRAGSSVLIAEDVAFPCAHETHLPARLVQSLPHVTITGSRAWAARGRLVSGMWQTFVSPRDLEMVRFLTPTHLRNGPGPNPVCAERAVHLAAASQGHLMSARNPRPPCRADLRHSQGLPSQESIALLASLPNLAHGPRQTRNRQASINDAQNDARGERQRCLPQA